MYNIYKNYKNYQFQEIVFFYIQFPGILGLYLRFNSYFNSVKALNVIVNNFEIIINCGTFVSKPYTSTTNI